MSRSDLLVRRGEPLCVGGKVLGWKLDGPGLNLRRLAFLLNTCGLKSPSCDLDKSSKNLCNSTASIGDGEVLQRNIMTPTNNHGSHNHFTKRPRLSLRQLILTT